MATQDRSIEKEIAGGRREMLQELIDSPPWRMVLQPLLLRKAHAIERTLAVDSRRPVEDIRRLQGQYQALMQMVDLDADDAADLRGEE